MYFDNPQPFTKYFSLFQPIVLVSLTLTALIDCLFSVIKLWKPSVHYPPSNERERERATEQLAKELKRQILLSRSWGPKELNWIHLPVSSNWQFCFPSPSCMNKQVFANVLEVWFSPKVAERFKIWQQAAFQQVCVHVLCVSSTCMSVGVSKKNISVSLCVTVSGW